MQGIEALEYYMIISNHSFSHDVILNVYLKWFYNFKKMIASLCKSIWIALSRNPEYRLLRIDFTMLVFKEVDKFQNIRVNGHVMNHKLDPYYIRYWNKYNKIRQLIYQISTKEGDAKYFIERALNEDFSKPRYILYYKCVVEIV